MTEEFRIERPGNLDHGVECEIGVATQNLANVRGVRLDLPCQLTARDAGFTHACYHCVGEFDRRAFRTILMRFTRRFERSLNLLVNLFDRFHFGVMSFSVPVRLAVKYLLFH